MNKLSYDKIAGSLIGLALGDAMGKPTEFMSFKEIMKAVWRSGTTQRPVLPTSGRVTDDTHMTLYTGYALAGVKTPKPSVYARQFRRAYVAWRNDPDSMSDRAPGSSCLASTRALANRDNKYWQRVVTLSKGCGANMRVAPVALMTRHEDMVGAAQQSAAMTHGHPNAIVATELTAVAIRMCAEGLNPYDTLDYLIRYAYDRVRSTDGGYEHAWLGELAERRWGRYWERSMRKGWAANIKMLEVAWNKLQQNWSPTSDACEGIGQAWEADSALAVAMYVAARHFNEPVYALARGARTNGDSDSIACIAGAVVGAYHGINVWPSEWVERVEFSKDLQDMAVWL